MDDVGEEDGDRLAALRRLRPDGGRRRQHGGLDRGKGRFLLEDRALEIAQHGARLDPEPLEEGHARFLVGLERIGLAPLRIEGEHQLPA